MSSGMKIADLRSVHILRHLTEEEMSAIKSVHVYGSNRSPFDGPSALYVTTNDEVFLAGFDSLVGKSCLQKVPDGNKGVLEGSLKVEELSGKSVERIVVGEEFGAALTTSKDLYLWGTDVGPVGTSGFEGLSRLALESHYDGAKCSECSQNLGPLFEKDPWMSLCSKCGRPWQNRVSSLPPPTSWTGRPVTVLGYPTTDTRPVVPDFFCLKCRVLKTFGYYETSNFNVLCCTSCNRLIDGDQYLIPPQDSPAPRKVTFPTLLPIVNIAAGKTFLLIQTTSQLIIWGELGGQKYSCSIINPDNVSFSKVACGSAHIAVISDKGDLYTCGVGSDGQLGYSWAATDDCSTLKKVPLDGPAVNVSCGLKSTVCLLQDGAQIRFGEVDKVVSGSTFSLNLLDSALICLPIVFPQNYTKVMASSIKKYSQSVHKSAIVTGDLTDVFIHLHGALVTSADGAQVKPGFCAQIESQLTELEPKEDQNSSQPEYQDNVSQTEPELPEKLTGADSESPSLIQNCPNVAHLFGQHLFSDVTLKLADGDFCAHRNVLYTSSAYFRQIFTDSKASAVLDMSSYNSAAYRGLLQYFYGVPLSQISCEDMLDLYVLATSYNEDWVAADLLDKIKTSINSDNVLLLLDKSKAANATELLQECQAFMNTPEFKNTLLNRASQNTDAIAELLRFLSVPKN